MRLKKFRVKDYRCINDSGWVEVRQRTALVGRNESGKTNLLLALQSLNPPEGMEELTFTKDFPRDRHKSEFTKDIIPVETIWELTDDERQELGVMFPRAEDVQEIRVSRNFSPKRYVEFIGLPIHRVNVGEVKKNIKSIQRSINASLRSQEASVSNGVSEAFKELYNVTLDFTKNPRDWAEQVKTAIQSFKEKTKSLGFSISDLAEGHFLAINDYADETLNDAHAYSEACEWIETNLPIFIYLDEFPGIRGHQNIREIIERKEANNLETADKYFLKLAKVAGIDLKEIHELLAIDQEQRPLILNRAGAVVTQKIQELWTDRKLKFRFDIDQDHFNTFVADSTTVYDVEVNLDERSRGFKWFFSFYVTFTADTAGGEAENAILLLDEPGLHLHAVAQKNLLDHFKNDYENQIIYTTHSAFMIPVDDLPSIRTVNISEEEGTIVTHDPTGDEKTLFPLQSAIGYDLTQTLFVGPKNLVVEGVSDFWYLSSISDYLNDEFNETGLPSDLVITPSGGAQKVSYMSTLLTAQNLKVLVLLDREQQGKRVKEDLVKAKLIREENVLFVSEGFKPSAKVEADLEDLLDPDVFHQLVKETYSKELEVLREAGKGLRLNKNIPRIVKRYEEAFEKHDIKFHKTRPAKLFLRKIAESPTTVLTPTSQECFTKLFEVITERLEKLMERDSKPFT